MYYSLCPRCKFRVATRRRICATCGFHFPSVDDTKDSAKNVDKSGFAWLGKVFRLASSDERKPEPTQEKPALGT